MQIKTAKEKWKRKFHWGWTDLHLNDKGIRSILRTKFTKTWKKNNSNQEKASHLSRWEDPIGGIESNEQPFYPCL